jgi:hypothetical protein
MSTWMMSTRGRATRWVAVGVGSLLATAGLASRASADHTLLEQVSTGPAGGNGAFAPSYVGASADGTRVFFTTAEPLVGDTDFFPDVYERSGGRRRSSRLVPRVATASTPSRSPARRPTGRGSSLRPRSRW